MPEEQKPLLEAEFTIREIQRLQEDSDGSFRIPDPIYTTPFPNGKIRKVKVVDYRGIDVDVRGSRGNQDGPFYKLRAEQKRVEGIKGRMDMTAHQSDLMDLGGLDDLEGLQGETVRLELFPEGYTSTYPQDPKEKDRLRREFGIIHFNIRQLSFPSKYLLLREAAGLIDGEQRRLVVGLPYIGGPTMPAQLGYDGKQGGYVEFVTSPSAMNDTIKIPFRIIRLGVDQEELDRVVDTCTRRYEEGEGRMKGRRINRLNALRCEMTFPF